MTGGDPGLRDEEGTQWRLDTLLHHYHCYLQALFELQREALIERDGQLAVAFADLHRQMLMCHVETEDALMLPLLAQLGKSVRWTPDVYLLEHRKIIKLSDRLIEQLRSVDERLTRRQSLRLLDERHALMHLLEHHEQREEEAMVVELQAGAAGQRLDNVVREAARRWQALAQRQEQTVAACRRNLSAYELQR